MEPKQLIARSDLVLDLASWMEPPQGIARTALAEAARLPVYNVLRPILIRRGVDLPLVLIFAGVIGGLFAFGLVGIFVGPVVLAVGQTLLAAWVSDAEPLPTDQA